MLFKKIKAKQLRRGHADTPCLRNKKTLSALSDVSVYQQKCCYGHIYSGQESFDLQENSVCLSPKAFRQSDRTKASSSVEPIGGSIYRLHRVECPLISNATSQHDICLPNYLHVCQAPSQLQRVFYTDSAQIWFNWIGLSLMRQAFLCFPMQPEGNLFSLLSGCLPGWPRPSDSVRDSAKSCFHCNCFPRPLLSSFLPPVCRHHLTAASPRRRAKGYKYRCVSFRQPVARRHPRA